MTGFGRTDGTERTVPVRGDGAVRARSGEEPSWTGGKGGRLTRCGRHAGRGRHTARGTV
ncbi:hypothetical protein GCM10018787_15330 [Streptomyces thermodiastaticus]|nr:hypothetical protein GCM10018787_15330 [Streptomyces thermodiastaticus]